MSVSESPRIPAWKRAIDVACCLAALPVLCLITVLMAIALRLTSPGPILYRQERVGYKGSRLMCYKFRTMVVAAGAKSHQASPDPLAGPGVPVVKTDSTGDSRLIPGGWLLRATGLDDLPQIINILQGEMSLVGPRPCLQYEYERYEPWHWGRFNAVPGLTGLSQVCGKNRAPLEEMVRLDVRYSETSSFWLDLKIILMTVPAMIVQVSEMRRARAAARRMAKARSSAELEDLESKEDPTGGVAVAGPDPVSVKRLPPEAA